MSVTLDIPDDILTALPGLPEGRSAFLLLELACSLYAKEVISLGQGGAMTGLSRFDFGRELGRRGIARQYDMHDLEMDFAYAGS